jgi:acetyl-CoA carboxylase/biotin carboxylase 1
MARNGVSHLVAENDIKGVAMVVEWLSFVKDGDVSPVLPVVDPVERDVEITIPAGIPYDPRGLLEGTAGSGDDWVSGFFDRGSFVETLADWAKGVVVGRARLGGIPIGCIAVETRATESIVAADPAVDSSSECLTVEAGGVWYPNSAAKTAQAINDFNFGEGLPLIVFANWRGFSGGQSDMNKEILKFGAGIVDALRVYGQPVFVYVVGELRGGAWVVLDSMINPEMIEMYAETESRGGVLEPGGMVEIKYRRPAILAKISQLDEVYKGMLGDLAECTLDKRDDVKRKMKEREEMLYPVYHSAALSFADLHDVPERMLAKGVIKKVVGWMESRSVFYWRLKRRGAEELIVKRISGGIEARKVVAEWVKGCGDDKGVVNWIKANESEIEKRVLKFKADADRVRIAGEISRNMEASVEGIREGLGRMSAEERRAFIERLSE